MAESKTSPRQLKARERQARALEMRTSGATYAEIAKALDYAGPSSVHKALTTALDNIIAPEVEALRTLEGQRYDAALKSIWPKVVDGDLDALHGFVRLSDRSCKLFGLDMPAKVAPTTPDGTEAYQLEPMTTEEAIQTYLDAIERATANDGD